MTCRRSRKGAWIEMMMNINPVTQTSVAPVRERGLKSLRWSDFGRMVIVAPVRERGLKFVTKPLVPYSPVSLP